MCLNKDERVTWGLTAWFFISVCNCEEKKNDYGGWGEEQYSDSLFTKFNKETVLKSGKHTDISKRQRWHTWTNVIKCIQPEKEALCSFSAVALISVSDCLCLSPPPPPPSCVGIDFVYSIREGLHNNCEKSFEMCICMWQSFIVEVPCAVDRTLNSITKPTPPPPPPPIPAKQIHRHTPHLPVPFGR